MQQRGSKPFSRSFSRKSKGKRRNNNNNQNFSLRLNTVLDSNGPNGHVKGTCQQLVDKYVSHAKEWRGQDDYIAAESCQQYAEHYNRLVATIMERMAETRANNPRDDANEEGASDATDENVLETEETEVNSSSEDDADDSNDADDADEVIDENIQPAAFQGLNVAFLNKEVSLPESDKKDDKNSKRSRKPRSQGPRRTPKKETTKVDEAKEDIA